MAGMEGVSFTVWAPSAESVSVVGDFNGWDEHRHGMRRIESSGIWGCFVAGVELGDKYKFRIRSLNGESIEKTDPFGLTTELSPGCASIIAELGSFDWDDATWMKSRENSKQLHSPMSIYELHLGSWRQQESNHHWLNYREIAHELVDYCGALGFTHVELLPVAEHPYTPSWGYQSTGYYSVTSRYGSPADFKYFVNYCHKHGIGVLLDWVPGHFPKDAHGLNRFDGTALYEHEDPRRGEHPDWGTWIFNFGSKQVCNFLIANALFWLDEYHIDGLRVDAVASMLYLDYSRNEGEWLPNKNGGRENLEAVEFLQRLNTQVRSHFPSAMTIAEESTAWPGVSRPIEDGGLGFNLKWNMGWMNDMLHYFRLDPIHRKHHHERLTFSLMYAFSENFLLPFSHDEVVHGKGSLLGQMPGEECARFANLRLLYGYLWCHPGKKLMFMGDELAQPTEWDHDGTLDWGLLQVRSHRGVQRLVADLNQLYRSEPALHELDFVAEGFQWLDCDNANESVLIFLRRALNANDWLLICCNFTPVSRSDYRVGVPGLAPLKPILNTDSECYGGSSHGEGLIVMPEDTAHEKQPHSATITLPPLSVVIFKAES